MNCYYCRDEGIIGGCPHCGKVKSQAGATVSPVDEKIMDLVVVPPQYRTVSWNVERLKESHISLKEDKYFLRYCSQLDKIYSIFQSGRIPNQSAILIAPRTFGKQTFAYCCMKEALNGKFTVSPIIDNTEFKRINILSGDRASQDLYKKSKYKIEEILDDDVVFMSIDKDNYQTSFRTMDSLLDKRARRGKPTFILTRFSLREMALFGCAGNDVENIVDYRRLNNPLRYPVVLRGMSTQKE